MTAYFSYLHLELNAVIAHLHIVRAVIATNRTRELQISMVTYEFMFDKV